MIGYRVLALNTSRPLSAIMPTYAQALRWVREFNDCADPVALVIVGVAFAKAGDCFFSY